MLGFVAFLLLCHTFMSDAQSSQRIVVVGGTHGNEYTGVWLVKELANTKALNVETYLSNTAAVAANRRFIDEDLNRRFIRENLNAAASTPTVESARSIVINEALGPKGSSDAADLIIDLHTTTSNMGITLIADAWCPFALRCAAFVQRKLKDDTDSSVFGEVRILYNDIREQALSPYLASIGKRGLQIEVGPTPQGVIRADCVAATRRALEAVVEFTRLEEFGEVEDLPESVSVYSTAGSNSKLSWPVDENGFPTAMVHEELQDRDWQLLKTGDPLWRDLNGETVVYDGEFGETITPMFINEGGYYYASSGRGIGITELITVKVPGRDAESYDAVPKDEL